MQTLWQDVRFGLRTLRKSRHNARKREESWLTLSQP